MDETPRETHPPTLRDVKRAAVMAALNNTLGFLVLSGLVELTAEAFASAQIAISANVTMLFLFIDTD